MKRGTKVGQKTVRFRVYLPAHSDGWTTTAAPTGADLLLSIILLCAVPPSLVDEFVCLRRGNKAALMNRLGIKLSRPRSPDILIVDGQKLLYHVMRPCEGDPRVLVASMKARIASLPGECVLVFGRYDHISPKGHEWMWRAGVGLRTTTYLSTVLF